MLRQIVFVSSSTEVWGAETSLLGIASKANNPILIAVEGELATEWRRQLGTEPVIVRKTKARRLQSITFSVAVIKLARRGVVFVGFCLNALPALTFAACIIRPLGAAVVLDLHNSATTAHARRRFRICTWSMNGIVAVSNYVLSQADVPTKAIVVHRPIGPTQIVDPVRPGAPLTVGYVGRLDPEKNIEEIILGVSRTESDVVRILTIRGESMVGDEQYIGSLKLLAEARLPGRHEFTGRLPHEVVMSGINVLVCANAHEPSGRTVAEAQRSGIPAVVPSKGGCPEFIANGVSGYTYKAGDPEDMATRIAVVAENIAGRRMAPDSVAKWAEIEYEEDNQAAKYTLALVQLSNVKLRDRW